MRNIKYLYDQISTIKYQISTIDLAFPTKKVMSASFFLNSMMSTYLYMTLLLTNRLATSSLRLQDTLFGVLWEIATARSKSVRFSSNFHQMLAVHAKYDKVVKLTNNKIM